MITDNGPQYSLHEKLDLHQIYLVQIWCKKVQTKVKQRAKMVNTAFALNLHPHVNWQSNAVVTIFAYNFPLVCTFLHHIYTE